MGEGWGEGEYSVISATYVHLPLPPSCLPPQVGEDKMKKAIVALPPGEGKSGFLRVHQPCTFHLEPFSLNLEPFPLQLCRASYVT
jgi:hypothetical protein